VPELALDDVERDTFSGEFDGVCVPELVFVPTSAQASLSRHDCYAELCEEVLARWDVGVVDVGIMRAMLVILPRSVSGEGGVDGQAGEQGEQGVDEGAVGSVRGSVSGGVGPAWLYAVVDGH
jgi:hypothetical protein